MNKVIIIGSGLAACQTARLLQNSVDVSIYTKGTRDECNSMLAQGGIATALSKEDTWQSHYQDTLNAGVQHNNQTATKILVKEGIKEINELLAEGMIFDHDSQGNLCFGLEGAHTLPRILHCHGDQTGKYLTSFVQKQLNQVDWQENCMVVDLLTDQFGCYGIRYIDKNNQLNEALADFVVLATGGVGGLYPLSSNNHTITSDGLAMATRAQAKLSDMEFIQFHPTLLTKNGRCYGLVSEAVRGAGAILVDEKGHHLLTDYPLKDLSPRDIVARELAKAYEEGHQVYLDISMIDSFELKFPQITKNLIQQNIPFTKTKKIPVRPGVHFIMGGVQTNYFGETTVNHLYAVGEIACTGVHGANRLASNSLLECLVFGRRVASQILMEKGVIDKNKKSNLQTERINEFSIPERQKLQQEAWKWIGVERTKVGMQHLLNWLEQYNYHVLPRDLTCEQIETANLCLTAEIITKAALNRTISLGAHARKD